MRMRSLWIGLLLLSPRFAAAQVFINVPGVRVNIAPPAPRIEVRPVAPSPRHVWVAGHWMWRGNRHVWASGAWLEPPNPGWVWEPARWLTENGAWVFFEGHWRRETPITREIMAVPSPVPSPPMGEVIVDEPPPAPIAEAIPVRPFDSAVWIPGYWQWQGNRHNWVAGYWDTPRGRDWRWQPYRWQREGNRWRFMTGGWRRF